MKLRESATQRCHPRASWLRFCRRTLRKGCAFPSSFQVSFCEATPRQRGAASLKIRKGNLRKGKAFPQCAAAEPQNLLHNHEPLPICFGVITQVWKPKT